MKKLSKNFLSFNHNMRIIEEYLIIENLSPNERVDDPNDELYYKMRDMFNGKILSEYEKATLYFFINKTAYSGMIRYNSLGEFNVPYGRYANFNTSLLMKEHHKLLSQATIFKGSYEKAFNLASHNDFIFLDPPYDTIFTEYGNETFTGDFYVSLQCVNKCKILL